MTDEELKELAKLECTKLLKSEKGYSGLSFQEFWEEGYKKGLAKGKPQWHKVADCDYPLCEKGNYSINVLTDRGDIAYYNYDECWVVEPSSVEIDPPIAWCEIPKYEE